MHIGKGFKVHIGKWQDFESVNGDDRDTASEWCLCFFA